MVIQNAIELSFRELLRAILKEVALETKLESRVETLQKEVCNAEHPLLMRSREAAKSLAISEAHLSRLTRTGKIPHVRVGQCLRYSVEALQKWIRESESTQPPPSRQATPKQLATTKPESKEKPSSKLPAKLPKMKRSTTTPISKADQWVPASSKRKSTVEVESEDRQNPLAELLEEIGIQRSSLPSLTNGELMRIAEVDLVVYHGWMYLKRQLPDVAREKLKAHFGPSGISVGPGLAHRSKRR